MGWTSMQRHVSCICEHTELWHGILAVKVAGVGVRVSDSMLWMFLALHWHFMTVFQSRGKKSIASIPVRDQSYTDIDGSYVTPGWWVRLFAYFACWGCYDTRRSNSVSLPPPFSIYFAYRRIKITSPLGSLPHMQHASKRHFGYFLWFSQLKTGHESPPAASLAMRS